MSNSSQPAGTPSANDVHPICRYSIDPEKCAEFVAQLEMVVDLQLTEISPTGADFQTSIEWT